MSTPAPAPNLDSSKQPSRTASQQVMFSFAQEVCGRQEHTVKEPGHDAKRRAYNPAETTASHSGPSRDPHQASFPQQSAAPTSLHAPISWQFDRSIFSARDESSSKQFDVDGFREQRSQKSQALYNSGTMGEALSPDFGTAKKSFALAPFNNAPATSLRSYKHGVETPYSPVYPPPGINALEVEHQRSPLNWPPTQAIDMDPSPSGAQQSSNQIEDQSPFSGWVPFMPTAPEFRYPDNPASPLSSPPAPTGQNVHQQWENARTSQAGVEFRSSNAPTINALLEVYSPKSPGSPVSPASPLTPQSSPPLACLPDFRDEPASCMTTVRSTPLSPPGQASCNLASGTSPLSPPGQVSNLDLSTSIQQFEHSPTTPKSRSQGHHAPQAIHGGTVTQKDASPNIWSAPSPGGPCPTASVPYRPSRCTPQASSFIAESDVPQTCYYDVNAYRWATSPPDAGDVLPPVPQLPLPAPLYHESETADRGDEIKRAQEALRAHMKNRWNYAFDASRKLQEVIGVSPGEAPHAAPHVLTEETLARHESPQKLELRAGFGTPQAEIDHERQQRSRSLQAILREHRRRPSCRYTKLASLSIHRVSGDLDADAVRRRSQNSLSVCDSYLQGPLKLHNELLAHYASSPGTFDGVGTGSTDIGMFQIDMPIDSDRESRSSPFERWLVLEISMPHIFRVPGTEALQIATIHPELHGGQYCVSGVWVAAPLADLIVENAKPIQDILTDGTPCLRQDYTFGPNVRYRLEFSEKPSGFNHFPSEWLCANMEIAWFPKGPESSKEYERHEKAYEMALKEGVWQDIARWDKIRHAMATGACRIVTRVVDEERIEKKKKSEAKRAAKSMTGLGPAQRSRQR